MNESKPFRERARGAEYLDDPGLEGRFLRRSLKDLRWINRWLGGRRSVRLALDPVLGAGREDPLRLLDLGSGLADLPAHLVEWADACGSKLECVAVDSNPDVLEAAARYLDRALPARLRGRIDLVEADARELLGEPDGFDLVTAALFLHHFTDRDAVGLLRAADRAARIGLVVSDLRRSRIAHAGVWLGTRLLGASPVTRHDGPLSVRRGFVREELLELAGRANLEGVRIRRRWAYRLVLTTTPRSAA